MFYNNYFIVCTQSFRIRADVSFCKEIYVGPLIALTQTGEKLILCYAVDWGFFCPEKRVLNNFFNN